MKITLMILSAMVGATFAAAFKSYQYGKELDLLSNAARTVGFREGVKVGEEAMKYHARQAGVIEEIPQGWRFITASELRGATNGPGFFRKGN